jgi:hypothetical protein
MIRGFRFSRIQIPKGLKNQGVRVSRMLGFKVLRFYGLKESRF